MEQLLRPSARTSAPLCGKRRLCCIAFALLLLPLLACAQAGEKMSVVEIIGPGKDAVLSENLTALCQKYHVPYSGIYRWQNHLIAYGKTENIRAVNKNLAAIYPGTKVNFYAAPFYKFDRQYCADKTVAKQWDNIILTANLVSDPEKQQEYLSLPRHPVSAVAGSGPGLLQRQFSAAAGVSAGAAADAGYQHSARR